MSTKQCGAILAGIACLAILSANAAGDDWLHWRGPSQNGISAETGLVVNWEEGGENVLWESEIGGRATPIILNDRVYLNCRTIDDVNDPEEKINARQQVVCWDAKTGDIVWHDIFNVFLTDIPAPRVGWASMCGDKETDTVFVYTVDGVFRCYEGATGKVLWEHSMLEEFGAISGYGGRTNTPIIDEDRVIMSTLAVNWGDMKGPGPAQRFFAFDKRTGEVQWISAPSTTAVDTNQSGAFITVINGQRQLIAGNSDGAIYAINARTGAPIWGFKMSRRGLNATATSDGKYVYITHGEDNFDNQKFGRVQCIDATGQGDVTETHGVWRYDGLKCGYTGSLVKDGLLFCVSDTGNLFCFDAAEGGDPLWEHDLGTVGKGSLVWADGHLYITEVNGNIYCLKAGRDGCETVNHVHLDAKRVEGADEIYASPAISNGRMVIVTRDRTLCLGTAEDVEPTAAPEMEAEAEPTDEVAMIQLRPYCVDLREGESASFEVHAFDANGRFLKKMPAESLTIPESLGPVSADGGKITAGEAAKDFAGLIETEVGGLKAMARVRVFPSAGNWKWDFEGFKGIAVPPTWVRAHIKMKPFDLDGNTVMVMGPSKGRPSHMVWFGTPEMSNYTIQSDVQFVEKARKLSAAGITNQRYNFILDANNEELTIRTWQPHLRMAKTIDFTADPDTWYVMKLIVDVDNGVATIRGKIWEKEKEEPAEWTLEATDPHANLAGSPGIYTYSLSDAYFDNIEITPRGDE